LQEVGNHLLYNRLIERERRPVAHMLLMVLWILATPDSLRSVALRFAISKSEVHDHYVLIIGVLRDMTATYITWPNDMERNIIKRNCQRISNFPGIVGIMDGSHVFIKAPREERAAYRNYKFGQSIKVQAVVADSLLVRDVYIGEVCSLHDARVFRRSPLCRSILQRPSCEKKYFEMAMFREFALLLVFRSRELLFLIILIFLDLSPFRKYTRRPTSEDY